MKRTILTFGVISGVIIAVLMVLTTVMYYNNPDYESGMVLGYASMILAFSLVFVGVKTLRDKQLNGSITFGKAFKTALYIMLISSTFYVIAWLIEYYVFMPDFTDKYAAHLLKEARDSGATQVELKNKMAEVTNIKELYKNPLFVILITYSEVLPVGIIVSLISALILKKKPSV